MEYKTDNHFGVPLNENGYCKEFQDALDSIPKHWRRSDDEMAETFFMLKLLKEISELRESGQRLVDSLGSLKLTNNSKALSDSDTIDVVTNIGILREMTTALENHIKLLPKERK